jgi:hypothetical protein
MADHRVTLCGHRDGAGGLKRQRRRLALPKGEQWPASLITPAYSRGARGRPGRVRHGRGPTDRRQRDGRRFA